MAQYQDDWTGVLDDGYSPGRQYERSVEVPINLIGYGSYRLIMKSAYEGDSRLP
jgi:hypothetical protein